MDYCIPLEDGEDKDSDIAGPYGEDLPVSTSSTTPIVVQRKRPRTTTVTLQEAT